MDRWTPGSLACDVARYLVDAEPRFAQADAVERLTRAARELESALGAPHPIVWDGGARMERIDRARAEIRAAVEDAEKWGMR